MAYQLDCTLVKALTKQEGSNVCRDAQKIVIFFKFAAFYALVEKNDLRAGQRRQFKKKYYHFECIPTKRSALLVLSGL